MTTILVVDDRRDALAVLEDKLQKKGFVVITASNGTQVLDICKAQEIDAVVMDMNMPELDGCEATEMLKGDEQTGKIPVIIITSHPMPGDQERAELAGCNGFLEKPIHLGTLVKMLGQLLNISCASSGDDVEESSHEALTAKNMNQNGESSDSTETVLTIETANPDVPAAKVILESES